MNIKLRLQKIGWFFCGRYSKHSDVMQPKLKDFPRLHTVVKHTQQDNIRLQNALQDTIEEWN